MEANLEKDSEWGREWGRERERERERARERIRESERDLWVFATNGLKHYLLCVMAINTSSCSTSRSLASSMS
jgi:hypothetical protein